jgi:hypothetical protein
MRMLACYEILKEMKRPLSRQIAVLDFFKYGLLHRHLYCWVLEIMIQMTRTQFKRKCLLLKLSFRVFVNFS